MWNFNEVKSVAWRGGRILHVEFDDGLCGEVDLSGFAEKGPMFAPMREDAFFCAVRLANGTIAWPNGVDIAPETLYEMVETSARRSAPASVEAGR